MSISIFNAAYFLLYGEIFSLLLGYTEAILSKIKKAAAIIGLTLAFASVPGFASIIAYGDRTTFNAQGTIFQNSNFDDFAGTSYTSPGNPFTRGDVTYTSQDNLIVGTCAYSIGCSRPAITNNYWSPLPGSINTSTHLYNLFGFDLAVTSGPVSITLYTNLTDYVFSGLSIGNGNPDFTFKGFQATDGEYFTGFRIDTLGSSYLPGMTDVALGVAGNQVPEPGSMALLGLGLAGLLMSRRRKKA